MDLSQATQMLRWLDDEHRKDKSQIAELHKKLDEQKELIVNQSQRIEALERRLAETQESLVRFDRMDASIDGLVRQVRRFEEIEARIASIQTSLYRFDQIETSLQQLRGEAGALLPKFEHELHTALEQALQTRNLERARDARVLDELRKDLEPVSELERRLAALALEDRRLNDQLPPIQLQLEKLERALSEQTARFAYLEEWSERLVGQIAELKLIEGRIRTAHAEMQETIRRSEEHQRQVLAQWSEEILEHRKRVDDAIASLPPVDDAYEDVRRVLAHFEWLDDELRDEQQKIAHLLQMNEERVKQTLAEYRSEYEKNWEQHLTMFDLYRKQQREMMDAVHARLEALEAEDAEQAERWHALREAWAKQSKRQLLEVERIHQELEASVMGKKRRLSIQ